MKNLFFTAIAMMAFSFAGNATSLVKSVNLKNTITIKSTNSVDDCTWTKVGSKSWWSVLADGSRVLVTVDRYQCL